MPAAGTFRGALAKLFDRRWLALARRGAVAEFLFFAAGPAIPHVLSTDVLAADPEAVGYFFGGWGWECFAWTNMVGVYHISSRCR